MTDDTAKLAADDAALVTPGPWREPVRGGHPPARLLARDGREQLRAMIAGETAAPPLSHLTGMRIDAVGADRASFSMPMSPWLTAPGGEIPLSVLTIPADAAMACAIIAGLPPHTGLTTTELSLRRLRPAPLGERLVADGRLLDRGDDAALAEASLRDEAGRLIAHAGSLCVTLPMIAQPPPEPDRAPDGAPVGSGDATPDPWQRQAGPDDGLDVLTGLRRLSAGEGQAAFAMPATPWLAAPPPGRAQGGTVAVLAEAALTAAMTEGAPEGARFVTTEMKINYLRPLATDGGIARATAQLVHRGRRVAVAEGHVVDARGRTIAVATGSALATGGGS